MNNKVEKVVSAALLLSFLPITIAVLCADPVLSPHEEQDMQAMVRLKGFARQKQAEYRAFAQGYLDDTRAGIYGRTCRDAKSSWPREMKPAACLDAIEQVVIDGYSTHESFSNKVKLDFKIQPTYQELDSSPEEFKALRQQIYDHENPPRPPPPSPEQIEARKKAMSVTLPIWIKIAAAKHVAQLREGNFPECPSFFWENNRDMDLYDIIGCLDKIGGLTRKPLTYKRWIWDEEYAIVEIKVTYADLGSSPADFLQIRRKLMMQRSKWQQPYH